MTRARDLSQIFATTNAEITAGVTPVDATYPPGDVRRYGAVGDGVTDDTTALIDACKGSGTHAWVYVPAHLDCLVTAAIVNSSVAAYAVGQTWYGGGRIRTANGFDHHVFDLVGITDFTVLRLRGLSGTLGATPSTATARFFRATASAHRCKLLYSHITGFQSAAQLQTSEHCQVIGNDMVSPLGWGVNVQTDAHYATVRDNRISDPDGSEHCIYVAGSAGNTVTDTEIHGNTCSGGLGGIKLSYSDDARVSDNTCFGNTESGILAGVGTTRAQIHSNALYDNGHHGILVYDTAATSDRNSVHHNTVRVNDRHGIYILSTAPGAVTNTVVADNDVDDNNQSSSTYNGINVSGAPTTGVKLRNNRVTNETTAILIGAGVVSAVTDGNTFASNTTNISDSGTTTSIREYTEGATSVADGGTVTHGHIKTPTKVQVTPITSGEFVSVTAIGATTFTVAIKKHDNSAGTTQIVYWKVSG